jgi:hypothetical protein
MMDKENKIIAVIDGDEVAYTIAAACEKRTIEVTNIMNDAVCSFKNRTEFKKFLTGLEGAEDFYRIKDIQTPDELANALHSVKVTIESIKQACKADELEVYISGKNNFRDALPLPSQYKSNRKDTLRPLLLQDVRAFLVKKYKAKVVNDQEVDDVVCTRMYDGFKTKQKIIGVTVDKDALGSDGWLYNRDKMTEPQFITGLGELTLEGSPAKVRGFGRKWKYLQWLIGDRTDFYNPTEICKIPYGEKSAYKLLEPLKTDKDCIEAVYNLYKTWYPTPVSYMDYNCQPQTKSCIEIMQMYFDCCHMRRWVNDTPSVLDMLNKLGVLVEGIDKKVA